MFDTQREYLDDKIREQRRLPAIGIVTDVNARETQGDVTNHQVNVLLRDEENEYKQASIVTTYNGHVSIPQVGDVVIVNFVDGDERRPYIAGYAYTDQVRPPLGRPGDWRLKVGDHYLELDPTNSISRLAQKATDLGVMTAGIEVDTSGAQAKVTAQAGDQFVDLDPTSNVMNVGQKSGGTLQNGIEVDLTNAQKPVLIQKAYSIVEEQEPKNIELTSQDTSTNLNVTPEVGIPWTLQNAKDTSIYTHSTSTNPDQITVTENGTYAIDMRLVVETTAQDLVLRVEPKVNDQFIYPDDITSPATNPPQTRVYDLLHIPPLADETTNYAVLDYTVELDLVANDVLTLTTRQANGAGTVTLRDQEPLLQIHKVPTRANP